MKKKHVKDSTVTMIQRMTPLDVNLAGNVHGGVIMRLIDDAAAAVATRHVRGNTVTASIDRLDFHHPVYIGDLLKINASINLVGKTSMEIGVRVESENLLTGDIHHTATAYLTYVALDKDGKPMQVPPVIFDTVVEKRRNREAIERREIRLHEMRS
ncbi:acyl-CoA thioesterase [Chloroflexota bacterium]